MNHGQIPGRRRPPSRCPAETDFSCRPLSLPAQSRPTPHFPCGADFVLVLFVKHEATSLTTGTNRGLLLKLLCLGAKVLEIEVQQLHFLLIHPEDVVLQML